jgi:hypothetical protein
MASGPVERGVQNAGRGRQTPPAASLELESIQTAIKGIRFGEVRIVIQDGVVIQIDRMEKQRIR